jgi:hypothetical protein
VGVDLIHECEDSVFHGHGNLRRGASGCRD